MQKGNLLITQQEQHGTLRCQWVNQIESGAEGMKAETRIAELLCCTKTEPACAGPSARQANHAAALQQEGAAAGWAAEEMSRWKQRADTPGRAAETSSLRCTLSERPTAAAGRRG